jgi:hypothetical protein
MIVYDTHPRARDFVLKDARTEQKVDAWVQVDTETGNAIVEDLSRLPDESGDRFFKPYPSRVRVYIWHYAKLCELTPNPMRSRG